MASRFSNIDPVTAANMRRQGLDRHDLDRSTEQLMSLIHGSLPDPPVSTTARLTAFRARPSDGVDRISRLSDALLRDIVSRLPVMDVARTAALTARWHGVWRSMPLVLVDTHLVSGDRNPARASTLDVTAAVSHILVAHQGPFRCVHLTCSRMGVYQAQLKRWIHLLAARGVQELVLVNRPWPCEVRLPKTLFTISTLTRLYIGVWKFPDVAGLQDASFPHLRELGIFSVSVEDGDIDAVVARSPALEIFNIQGSMKGVRLCLVSNSLRCVQIRSFAMESIDVVNAPRLKRLLVSECLDPADGSCTRIKIGHVPKLKLLGYLEPGKFVLEIQDTVIMTGIKTNASMMVTSVKTLSLRVRFRVYDDVKMVPAFLKCFPNVEALHITVPALHSHIGAAKLLPYPSLAEMFGNANNLQSEKCDQLTGKFDLKFWEEVGPIVSVLLRLKVITFREYRVKQDELSFLQYIFQNAMVLKYVHVQMINPRFTSQSLDEMSYTIHNMSDEKWANRGFNFAIGGTHGPEGGEPLTFQRGADLSDDDLVAPVKFITRG